MYTLLSLALLIFAISSSSVQANPAPGQAAKPPTWKNNIGMEFVLIPAGSFKMGAPLSDQAALDKEKPSHEVTISQPFYMGKHEVTQAQWRAVMDTNPSEFTGDQRPVENITWMDIQSFIHKLNNKAGYIACRLPTEAEWEFAARAGQSTIYSFGNDPAQLGDYAWYDQNSGRESHPVGQKKPNGWGLYGMHGNVREWVQDSPRKFTPEPVTDPQGSSSTGPFRFFRAIKGGSWFYPPALLRSSFRLWNFPSFLDSRLGFRCASPGPQP